MSVFELKKGKTLIPVILDSAKSNILQFACYGYADHEAKNDWFNLFNKSVSFELNQCYNKGKLNPYIRFYKGIIADDYIIMMIVRDKDFKEYCLIQQEFTETYPGYFKLALKHLKANGITRKEIIIGTRQDIQDTFVGLIRPALEDYQPLVQEQVIKEFLETQIELCKQTKVEETVPEDLPF